LRHGQGKTQRVLLRAEVEQQQHPKAAGRRWRTQ
jgi:hypothetical protein